MAFERTVHNIIALSGYNKIALHSNGLARALVDLRQDQEAFNYMAYYWAGQRGVTVY